MNFITTLEASELIALFLALGVVLINGFTDAPNAIATTVATRALSMNRACLLCALFNLLGLIAMSALNMSVADNVIAQADFGEKEGVALICVFSTVIIFSLISWLFSMPSSESHALLASLAGASLALAGRVNVYPFIKIIVFMLLSCVVSLLLSILCAMALKNAILPYHKLQIISCATSSFMHGAQDGQKLVALLLVLISRHGNDRHMSAILMVAIVLFLGTLLGGGRIVKTLGSGIARLNAKSAFVADASASACLLLCSLFGAPVSTSNVKACTIAGSAICEGESVNYKSLGKLALVAVITLPVCMLISYLLVLFFNKLTVG